MRPRLVLAALLTLLLAPSAAFAQQGSPGEDEPAPMWTLGAGVTFFGGNLTSFPGFVGVGGIPSVSASVPAVDASLERRLGGRSWLVLGAAGAVARERADVPDDDAGFTRDDGRQLYLTAGVRRPVTAASAPVEVSVLFLAEAGVADADLRYEELGVETRASATRWLAGGSAGIAIDRVLTGPLSLRVASPLLRVAWSFDALDVEGEPGQDANAFAVRALLAPRLELRLAF